MERMVTISAGLSSGQMERDLTLFAKKPRGLDEVGSWIVRRKARAVLSRCRFTSSYMISSILWKEKVISLSNEEVAAFDKDRPWLYSSREDRQAQSDTDICVCGALE